MSSRASDTAPIPEPAAERKKPRRLWLFAPYIALLAAAGGYGGFWWVSKLKLEQAIDQRAEALRSKGYVVDLEGRRLTGFPFRLKLSFDEARVASPSGWSLTVPKLGAEAYLHAPGHWVIAAPEGLTFSRPQGGPVAVKGQALRASIAGVDRSPWRIVLQGTKLDFQPAPGARPFFISKAERIELYLKPGPDEREGMTLFRLEGGKAGPGSRMQALAGDALITATAQANLTQPERFSGPTWSQAVRAWGEAGGVLSHLEGQAAAGKISMRIIDGTLGVDGDGRLEGALPLELKQAGPALAALSGDQGLDPAAAKSAAEVAAARAQGEASKVNLVFQAGAATLGPVRIGPAPRIG